MSDPVRFCKFVTKKKGSSTKRISKGLDSTRRTIVPDPPVSQLCDREMLWLRQEIFQGFYNKDMFLTTNDKYPSRLSQQCGCGVVESVSLHYILLKQLKVDDYSS